jgi:hypothetical protein
MIYVIDIKTGETISEMMGDETTVAQMFLKEHIRQGARCFLTKRRYGYEITEELPTGQRRALLEIRRTQKRSLWSIVLPVMRIVFVAVWECLKLYAREKKTVQGGDLFNPLRPSKRAPSVFELLLVFLN